MGIIGNVLEAAKVSPIGVGLLRVYRYSKGKGKKNAYKVMKDFGCGEMSEQEKKMCFKDMMNCSKKYHFSFVEYFQFNLSGKNEEQRMQFVSEYDRVRLCEDFNITCNQYIFDNKAETAKHFHDFFKREYICFENKNDQRKVKEFLEKNNKVIVKPLSSCGGHGVKIVENKGNAGEIASQLIQQYCGPFVDGAIMEQLIDQDERMKQLHPQSVNTVRIPTIRLDNRVVIFHPVLRIGRGDSVVDNTKAGGLICPVDADSGAVLAACDRKGNVFKNNPNTGEPLIGFVVPEWDKAIAFVKEMANVIPENRYTGWDIALTKNGWTLIEANARGQWGSQIALQKGYRQEIENYRKELGLPTV